MPNLQPNASEHDWRLRCYGCYRPIDRCFCNQIPQIKNQTHVLILQHFRERFHPFNTARILRRSLQNSRMVVDGIPGLAKLFSEMPPMDNSALLYPGHGSQLLECLSQEERPKNLVVLDGTWHHTKTLFRDIPQLKKLRKVRLAPSEPSRYGIRREPHILFLSTLEATVAALQCIEPETEGFERLVAAFHFMVENQLAHPKSEGSVRRKLRPPAPLNIPKSLRDTPQNIVVFYAETAPQSNLAGATESTERAPAYWVAERMKSGERFERTLSPPSPLSESFLAHIDLSASDFETGSSIETFRQDWNSFLKPTDTLAYYYSNCTRLLDYLGPAEHPRIYLKSIQLHRGRKNGEIEDLLSALNAKPAEPKCKGRAGRRLANSLALASYLSQCDLTARSS